MGVTATLRLFIYRIRNHFPKFFAAFFYRGTNRANLAGVLYFQRLVKVILLSLASAGLQ